MLTFGRARPCSGSFRRSSGPHGGGHVLRGPGGAGPALFPCRSGAFRLLAVPYLLLQEARAYAPMLFFFSLALLFFLRATRKGEYGNWIGSAFSRPRLLDHFYAFVPVGILILLAFAFRFRAIRANLTEAAAPLLALGVFLILALPLVVNAVQLFLLRTGGGPSFGIQGFSTITLTLVQISGFNAFLAVILLILFIAGMAGSFPGPCPGRLLAAGLLLPLLASVFLSYRMPMVPGT